MRNQRLCVALPVILAALLASPAADAYPMFTRKYETGCVTCHIAIDKLNTFGTVFRDNGFEWPGDDQDPVRQQPIVLSAEANREGFPNTIWPSWMPRSFPLSALVGNELRLAPSADRGVDAKNLGGRLEIAFGGAIARGIAVRADVLLTGDLLTEQVAAIIEKTYIQFILWRRHLDLRIGKLWPEVFVFPDVSLVADPWLLVRPLGDTPFHVTGRPGAELHATLLRGRMRLVAGTAASAGTIGSRWDAWARVGVKIGGLRYDGIEEGGTSSPGGHPWRDNALQLGVLGYYGHASYTPVASGGIAAPPAGPVMDEFVHVGGSLNLWLWDLNLFGAVVAARHDHLYALAPANWFMLSLCQVDYVIFPWLVPSVMFEYSGDAAGRPYRADGLLWHVSFGINFLVRANIRAYTYAEIAPSAMDAVAFASLRLGVLAAF